MNILIYSVLDMNIFISNAGNYGNLPFPAEPVRMGGSIKSDYPPEGRDHTGEFFMRNLLKIFGTRSRWLCAIVIIAVIGLSFVSCGGGGDEIQTVFGVGEEIVMGSWTFTPFNDSNDGGSSTIKATVSWKDNKITFSGNVTNEVEWGGNSGWVIMPTDSSTMSSLRAASSFSFKIMNADGVGVKPYELKVITSNITDYSYYHRDLSTSVWATLLETIDFSELEPTPWGQSYGIGGHGGTPFDKTKIQGIQFSVSEIGPFNITVWDLTVNP